MPVFIMKVDSHMIVVKVPNVVVVYLMYELAPGFKVGRFRCLEII